MGDLAYYLNARQAAQRLTALGQETGAAEFAQVRNLDFVFSPYELYPLAPHVRPPLQRIAAFAIDMDGTSTTTEPLALHALEYMVRRITGRLDRSQWPGLDAQLDYPHVIGSSNFRHTEFLVQRYRDCIDRAALAQAFIEAVTWTLACMTDASRRRTVTENARHCGLAALLADGGFRHLVEGGPVDAERVGELVRPLVVRYGQAFQPGHESQFVAAVLDIYYMRYHSILQQLQAGAGELLARELLTGQTPGPQGPRRLVEPMPGYDVFVPLIKGWLGPEIEALYEPLRDCLLGRAELGHTAAELDRYRPRLAPLAERFRRQPAKLALVTASIAYETQACMDEVMRVTARQVQQWPVSAECRARVAERLAERDHVFDGFVCASDTWEARLKPHRDLYSLALYQMGVPKAAYRYCVGLEDTEPGIIALRAAGVGCAVALPNRDTSRQNYAAATEIVRGGLPELILARNLLLAEGDHPA
jgi:beta-phosphoglucomutase-like phosphatase (HAD superfamily)